MKTRLAMPEDGERVGMIHVRAWQESYKGIVPQAHLDSLDPVERGRVTTERLRDPDNIGTYHVALDDNGVITGFGVCGKQRDDSLGAQGEIFSIYLLDAYKGMGYGRALMVAMMQDLLARGYEDMTVWVLSDNEAACGFYECAGGVELKRAVFDIAGTALEETCYIWRDITSSPFLK